MPRIPRVLAAAPPSFLTAGTSEPAFGAYAGPLPAVQFANLGLRHRVTRRKRWIYVALATEEVWFSVAIVRTGYAATAFAFAYDLAGQRMMLDRTVLGPAPIARVSDDFHAAGEIARFSMGKTSLALTRRARTLDLHVRMRDLEIDAAIDEATGAPAITAIANLGDGLVNGTEKRALLSMRGRASSGNREVVLDGGTAGYDYTHGLLPRHTKWRWAFALGKTKAGEPFGFNLVQGFVGEDECAAFLGGKVSPLAEPRFEFDVAQPMRQWRLVGEGIDLAFEPGGIHAQNTNLGLVKSRFVQPVGTFTGTLRIDGRDVYVEGLPGVVEDQDVLW
ncbi:MAG: hypothetical protein JWO86_6781 [Myxococcaceae bacterium]|nr:hypothetical protein [Myxococcaceae bacterium]